MYRMAENHLENSALSGTEPIPATSTTPEGARMGVRHRRRGQQLPLELRLRLYPEVFQLRGQGLSYRKIAHVIYKCSGVRVSHTTMVNWVNGRRTPFGNINYFDARPSPELCYIIGTVLSDGSLISYSKERSYIINLRVKDYEYAAEFSRCLAKVLRRKEPYGIRRKDNRWFTEAKSILLYKFLKQPLEKLKPYIEHNEDCAAAFLRAFFDGEGSVHGRDGRDLNVYNTDKQLLIYIEELLKRHFDINSTEPRIIVTKGVHCSPTGKQYRTNKDCYYVRVRTDSLLTFYKAIGFTIKRKQLRLAEAVE